MESLETWKFQRNSTDFPNIPLITGVTMEPVFENTNRKRGSYQGCTEIRV